MRGYNKQQVETRLESSVHIRLYYKHPKAFLPFHTRDTIQCFPCSAGDIWDYTVPHDFESSTTDTKSSPYSEGLKFAGLIISSEDQFRQLGIAEHRVCQVGRHPS